MTGNWARVEAEAPELAGLVCQQFDAGKHKTMATLRKDGSPRISGTEVVFAAGGVWLGSMPGAVKARDLLRDGRCAIHAPTIDDTMAVGDAKIGGVASEVTDLETLRQVWPEWGSEPGANAFCVQVTEVVVTRVEDDELVITTWHPDEGRRERRRH